MQPRNNVVPIQVNHYPTEQPLFVVLIIISSLIWLGLLVSIIGITYALLIGLVFFVSHMLFITHIRGSAIKLGPDQFPDLYRRVTQLCEQVGLYQVPDTYIMQAGGTLNAMATKFLRSKMIILYSDLLEACGSNKSARDMVIGHEIGHIKADHLKWIWFIFPAMFIPFLGSAYSRAREYTCDRYGTALCGDKKGALVGLSILSAGGKVGPHVNLHAFVNQKIDLNTGLMTIGQWLSTYPPILDRIAAIEPLYASNIPKDSSGTTRAIIILAVIFLVPLLIAIIAGIFVAML